MSKSRHPNLLVDVERMQALHESVHSLVQDSILLMIRIAQDPHMPTGARRSALEHLREVSASGAVSHDVAMLVRGLVDPPDAPHR